jgi:hypothetical protein
MPQQLHLRAMAPHCRAFCLPVTHLSRGAPRRDFFNALSEKNEPLFQQQLLKYMGAFGVLGGQDTQKSSGTNGFQD